MVVMVTWSAAVRVTRIVNLCARYSYFWGKVSDSFKQLHTTLPLREANDILQQPHSRMCLHNGEPVSFNPSCLISDMVATMYGKEGLFYLDKFCKLHFNDSSDSRLRDKREILARRFIFFVGGTNQSTLLKFPNVWPVKYEYEKKTSVAYDQSSGKMVLI